LPARITKEKKRPSRAKPHVLWEQAQIASGGFYSRNLEEIAHRYPTLTPQELRVCALVRAMLPNWKIGEMLGISEKTVENHRHSARLKMGVSHYSELLPGLF
jgi:DNA-binding CsgD family transcriptional regulator